MAARKASSSKSESALSADTQVCVLHGSEDMRKREHLDTLRAALAEAHGEIESITYDGSSCELADVLDELRSYGLMQQHKVVIVDHADEFLKTYRQQMENYVDSPVDNATLVLRSNNWNKGKIDKAIEKVGAVIKCEALKRPELIKWLSDRAVSAYDRKLDKAAAELLVDRMGSDMGRLDSEVAKLSVMVDDGQPVTADLVEQVVGRASDEQAWVLQEALLESLLEAPRDPRHVGGAAIEKLNELIQLKGESDVFLSYVVADLVRKLFRASVMQRHGVSDNDICKAMRIFGPQRSAFLRMVKRLEPLSASRLFDRIVDYDAGSKSGRGTAVRNLECFCALLADNLN